jgi:hypothetical protein
MTSLRDAALNAKDLQETLEPVREWPNPETGEPSVFLLRGMTGKQRIQLVDKAGNDRSHMYADILIATALDPDTAEAVFDVADRDSLMGKSGAVLERLALIVIQDLSGVSVDDAETEVAADPTSVGA